MYTPYRHQIKLICLLHIVYILENTFTVNEHSLCSVIILVSSEEWMLIMDMAFVTRTAFFYKPTICNMYFRTLVSLNDQQAVLNNQVKRSPLSHQVYIRGGGNSYNQSVQILKLVSRYTSILEILAKEFKSVCRRLHVISFDYCHMAFVNNRTTPTNAFTLQKVSHEFMLYMIFLYCRL